jgi:hypothetical protein
MEGQVITCVNVRIPVHPMASVAVTVNVEDPASEGVPVSVPWPDNESPAGSEPDVRAKAYGPVPPVAVIV